MSPLQDTEAKPVQSHFHDQVAGAFGIHEAGDEKTLIRAIVGDYGVVQSEAMGMSTGTVGGRQARPF